MEKRLYRLRESRMIGGVCTGLGEYFNLDPVLIRIVFIVLALQGGAGVIAYIVLWIVVPYRMPAVAATMEADPDTVEDVEADIIPPISPDRSRMREKRHMYGGVLLIALGLLFLLDNFLPSFGVDDFWPLILIAIGGSMLYKSFPQHNSEVAS